jgi:type I restriction enzyme S subunit
MFSASGTVFSSISKTDIQKFNVKLPPMEIEQHFNDRVDAMNSRIELNENEIITLTSIRDTLLPKLLSGEIRVRDAEKEVEAAL